MKQIRLFMPGWLKWSDVERVKFLEAERKAGRDCCDRCGGQHPTEKHK